MTVAPSGSEEQAPPLPEPTGPVTVSPTSHRRFPAGVRRWWWVLGAAIVAAVIAAGVALWWPNRTTYAAPAYRSVAVTTGTMRLTTATSGTLEPAQLASLNFPVSGQVATVAVSLGQHVRAGQTLATITSAGLAAQVSQAEATLAGEQAKTTADQNADASAAQIAADQAAVAAARASLANSRASLGEATLTSPIAGTVAQLNLTVGQQLTGGAGGLGGATGGGSATFSGASSGGATGSGSSASGGTTSSTSGASSPANAEVVVAGSTFQVDVPVDDTQIGLMKVGEQAVIVPQGTTTSVYGTVSSVGLLASTASGVASFPVVVSVTGAPKGLFAGATAAVTIVYRQLSNVLEVPAAAVHYSGGRAGVLQNRGAGTVSVPVGVGVSAGGFTQITAGLSEGQQVLVPATSSGRPGSSTTGPGTGSGAGTRRGGGFGGGGFGGGGFGGGGTGR